MGINVASTENEGKTMKLTIIIGNKEKAYLYIWISVCTRFIANKH